MEFTTPHINYLAAGSIPAEGSSSIMTCGLPRIAIATCNFLLFPPLNYSAGILMYF